MTKKMQIKLKQAIISFLAIVSTLGFLLPIFWATLTAFKFRKDIFTSPPKFIFTPTLINFIHVLKESYYLKYLLNSIVISTLAAITSVFVGTLAAYAFSRFYIRGSKNILLWILSLRMIPPIAVVVPFYLMALKPDYMTQDSD